MPGVARDTHDCDSVCEEEVSRCFLTCEVVVIKVFWGVVCCDCWGGRSCASRDWDDESVERCGGNSLI